MSTRMCGTSVMCPHGCVAVIKMEYGNVGAGVLYMLGWMGEIKCTELSSLEKGEKRQRREGVCCVAVRDHTCSQDKN